MANIRYLRLAAYFLLGLILGANVVIAHAESIPALSSYSDGGGGVASSISAACGQYRNMAAQVYIANGGDAEDSDFSVSVDGVSCILYRDGSLYSTFTPQPQPPYSCPSASPPYTLNGEYCTRSDIPPLECPAGQIAENGVCVADCAHESRNLQGQNFGGTGAYTAGGQLCIGGCAYNTDNGITGCKNGHCIFEAKLGAVTGARCTPPQNPVTMKNDETRTPEEKCLANKQGYVTTNGVTTCVASGTPGSPVITHTDSPSTTTTPGGTTTTNTTTTVNPDGTVTQTTTTTPPGGGAPVTEQSTQSKEKFCEENPNASICKNGTFGGSCTTGFVCDGDGIQCAIARAKHRENCELFDNATTLSNLGNALGQGSDPSGDLNTFKTSSIVNLPTSLDQTNPYGAAGLSDLTVSLGQFGSFTIPFSTLNFILEIMGHIMIALAMVAAGRIIGAY